MRPFKQTDRVWFIADSDNERGLIRKLVERHPEWLYETKQYSAICIAYESLTYEEFSKLLEDALADIFPPLED